MPPPHPFDKLRTGSNLLSQGEGTTRSEMKFGFVLPNNWGIENPQDVIEIAVKAEALGFDSVWVNHHILNVGYVLDRLGSRPFYDALTVLTYVAAKTQRVKLGTSVLVLSRLGV